MGFLFLNKTKLNRGCYNEITGSFNRWGFFFQQKWLRSAGSVIKRLFSIQNSNIDAARDFCVLSCKWIKEKYLVFCYFMYQDRKVCFLLCSAPMNRCDLNRIRNKMLTSFRLWLWNLRVKLFFQDSDFHLIILKLSIKRQELDKYTKKGFVYLFVWGFFRSWREKWFW